jgi:hypothetical protein
VRVDACADGPTIFEAQMPGWGSFGGGTRVLIRNGGKNPNVVSPYRKPGSRKKS